jgi:hypothetical protein
VGDNGGAVEVVGVSMRRQDPIDRVERRRRTLQPGAQVGAQRRVRLDALAEQRVDQDGRAIPAEQNALVGQVGQLEAGSAVGVTDDGRTGDGALPDRGRGRTTGEEDEGEGKRGEGGEGGGHAREGAGLRHSPKISTTIRPSGRT